jgi:hypothetical protein
MALYVLGGLIDEIGFINYGSHTDLPEYLVDKAARVPAGPVVDAHERIPSENQRTARSLLYIGSDLSGVEMVVVYDGDIVLGQSVLAVFEQTGSTA